MDKTHAFELGLAFGRGLMLRKHTDAESLATDELQWITLKLAQDTKEDGFATLTDKEGHTYVAQLNEGEKERYKETGKKLSQVKKEEKEKQSKKYGSEKERINDIIKQLDKKDEEYRKTNTIITREPSYLDVRKAMESDFVKDYPALSRIFTKGQFEDNRYLAAIINNNDFADKKDLKEYLKENYPGFYKDLQKAEEKEFFRASSPSGKFFGKNGTEKVTGQYFKINHNPDENTVIIEAPENRLRVTGRGDLVFLTDKNKCYYLNEKSSLPVLSYNKDDNTHNLHMAVKLNKDYLKEYTFKNEFDGTENLKPISGFEDLKKIAAEQDKNKRSYKNVSGSELLEKRSEYMDDLKKWQSSFRKPAETESEEQSKEKIKNNLLAAGGKIWDGGEKGKRIYLNSVYKKILPVMTDYVPLTKNFSHDNYSYFYYNGERYKPQDVKWFYGIINKAYYDVDTGKFVNAGVFSDEFEERAKNYEPKPKAPEFKPKTMEELKPYLKDWKGKLYKYGDGTKALFSKGQKIILTPEQFEALVPLAKR